MDSDIVIPPSQAPAIPQLVFRRFRDATDYQRLAEVHSGARVWDQIDPESARESVPTADQLARTFPESLVVGRPDLLIADVDGVVVGYAHVCWRWREATGTHVYLHLCYTLPAWRGQGIGTALLGWAHQRIRELAQANRNSGPMTCATNVSSTERETDTLIRHAGYTAVRRLSDMKLHLTEPVSWMPLPEGFETRPFDPSQSRDYYAAWKEAFAPLWTSTPISEEDYREFLTDTIERPAFDPALCHSAWVDDQLAGFVLANISQGIGRISEVAVRPAWQRRGIAKTLMSHALNTLYDRGVQEVRLFTDAENGQGAKSLYEQLGFREIKHHIFYRKPFD